MKDLKSGVLLFIIFTVICGSIYPAIVTGIAQAVFPGKANGSLIVDRSGRAIGSRLLGQPFSDARYFWPRPSAATDFAYNALGSSGSNSGPTNPDYLKTVSDRVKSLRDSGVTGPIPADLVQASASGLDPHISIEAARVQVRRVAEARSLKEDTIAKLVVLATEKRQLGFMGEPGVNVTILNLELDKIRP